MSTYYGNTSQDPSDAAREARIEDDMAWADANPASAPDDRLKPMAQYVQERAEDALVRLRDAYEQFIPYLRRAYPFDTAVQAMCYWVEWYVGVAPTPEAALKAIKDATAPTPRQPITTEQAQAWFDPGVPLPASLDNLHTTTP